MAVRTAVLMLNLGGPRKAEEVREYLMRMFGDRTFITMPPGLGPIIGSLRAASKTKQYSTVGFSPLQHWTDIQGQAMTQLLNSALPTHAPFKHYCAFRYAEPLASSAVSQAIAEGAERIILFTQYPHYSCASTGNSVRDALEAVPAESRRKVSIIYRWPTNRSYIEAWRGIIVRELKKFPDGGKHVPILFSAHSLPASVVWHGDLYPYEIGATVSSIMSQLPNPYSHSWQSKVGLQTWLQPSTQTSLLEIAKSGRKEALIVPIAFTSDHFETLFELDRELVPEAKARGLTNVVRCAAPNDDPAFIKAMAEVVTEHIQGRTEPKLHRCVKCRFPSECQKLWAAKTAFGEDNLG